MTFKQKYDQTTSWYHKITIINLFHHMMLARKQKWSIRKTAEYFDVSHGLVCENLKLANHLELIRDCKNRKEALGKIK